MAERVSKDVVKIKYRCVIDYKISLATFSADLYMAQFNCKNMNSEIVHLQSTAKSVEGITLEPNFVYLTCI
jgi:hypothetical protein